MKVFLALAIFAWALISGAEASVGTRLKSIRRWPARSTPSPAPERSSRKEENEKKTTTDTSNSRREFSKTSKEYQLSSESVRRKSLDSSNSKRSVSKSPSKYSESLREESRKETHYEKSSTQVSEIYPRRGRFTRSSRFHLPRRTSGRAIFVKVPADKKLEGTTFFVRNSPRRHQRQVQPTLQPIEFVSIVPQATNGLVKHEDRSAIPLEFVQAVPQHLQDVPRNFQTVPQDFQDVRQNLQEAPQGFATVHSDFRGIHQDLQQVRQNLQKVRQNLQGVRHEEVPQSFKEFPKRFQGVHDDFSVGGTAAKEEGYPGYEFGYEIRDDLTRNYQAREETRDGDRVQGVYRVLDPDGHLRIVTYGDDGDGFYARVERIPHAAIFENNRLYQER